MNSRIYGYADPKDLLDSVRTRGVLEPIVVNASLVVLSGHRRLAAARALGLKSIPVRAIQVEDEVQAIVAFNRHRRKTCKQVARECDVLRPSLESAALLRQTEGRRKGTTANRGASKSPPRPKRRVLDDLAMITGFARESLRRMLLVVAAVESGRLPEEVLSRIDAGRMSINQAHRLIGKTEPMERGATTPWPVCPFDVWEFRRRSPDEVSSKALTEELLDRRFRRCPQEVIANLLHYFSAPGDLIVDPMAGSGAVGQVASQMARISRLFDLFPKTESTEGRDAAEGPPQDVRGAALLFLDPPWGDMIQYSTDPRDLSNEADPVRFVERLRLMLACWSSVLRPGGRIAVLCGSRMRGTEFIDSAWMVGRMMEEFGTFERRLLVPYSYSNFQPWKVARAKEKGVMLTRIAELFVVRTRTLTHC